MIMKKITVCDNRGRFHLFNGENIAFFAGADGCEIINFGRERDKKLAHFSQYQWVKEEEQEGLQGRDTEFISHDEANQIPDKFTPPAQQAPDPFTKKALEERDTPVLDHNSLAHGAPIDRVVEDEGKEEEVPQLAPEEQQQTVMDIVNTIPVCETCNGNGTVQDPESEDPLDTVICPDC